MSVGTTEIIDEGAPRWLFEIDVDGVPHGRVFADKTRRNWVFWHLSEYVLARTHLGDVTVRQYINGEWRPCNDWHKLTN